MNEFIEVRFQKNGKRLRVKRQMPGGHRIRRIGSAGTNRGHRLRRAVRRRRASA